MDLLDWNADLPKSCQIYAIIDPLAENEPLKYWYQHADSTDAWPLYVGTEYGDDLLSGPWLLPLAQLPSWSAWWQEQEENEQATGFLIASESSPERLVQHWKSLIKAGLDGEEVLFRFYDPRVLGPMLFTFTEDETRRFLGPTNEMLVWHQGEWMSASPYPEPDMTEHSESWWRMQSRHFVGQPGQENTVVDNMEYWLWKHYPEQTKQWLKTNQDLHASLVNHYQNLPTEQIPWLWQPIWLLLHLFGYPNWWPEIKTVIRPEDTDEQTDVMTKAMDAIKKHKATELGA